jgi:hypothetical protein
MKPTHAISALISAFFMKEMGIKKMGKLISHKFYGLTLESLWPSLNNQPSKQAKISG